MELIHIYDAFCDLTRLRILHLLMEGPLCVCHFQELLGEPQIKISKRLAHLKRYGAVESHRHQNWMIYQLPENRSPAWERNLRCLRECVRTDPIFAEDLRRRKALGPRLTWIDGALDCCRTARPAGAPRRKRSRELIPSL